jgi:predicted acyltransferase
MFIIGVAMVFSYQKRWDGGDSWVGTLGHAARRAIVLFFLGWALARVNPIESGGRANSC